MAASIFEDVLFEPLRQSAVYDLLVSYRASSERRGAGDGPITKLADRHPLKVLVAEDNHVNQKVILDQLQRLGYEADAVSNGLEAVEAVRIRSYDVVLMDLHMPDMDGFAAAESIRSAMGEFGPAIVALTADTGADARASAREIGIDAYLTKPINESELRDVLVRSAKRPFGNGAQAS